MNSSSVIHAQAQVTLKTESAGDLAAIQTLVAELTSEQFETRQAASESLIALGDAAIEVLQTAAVSDDLETSARCMDALIEIAKHKKSRPAVLAAMTKLASDETSKVSTLASKQVELLSMTDEELAVKTLESYGERILRIDDRPIRSLRITMDKSASQLKHFPDLQVLSLDGPKITDNALLRLSDLRALSSISIQNTSVTCVGLVYLEGCRPLRSLQLQDRVIDESLVTAIGRIPGLQRLTLQTRIGTAELAHLEKLPKLTWLSLSNVVVSEQGADSLNRLRQINLISLSVSKANDEECGHMARLKSLESLSLHESPAITSHGWASIAKANFRKISIDSCDFGDEDLKALSSSESIQNLYISNASLTDTGLQHLRGNKSLTSISLQDTKVTRTGVDNLVTALPRVRFIRFNGANIEGGQLINPRNLVARPDLPSVRFMSLPGSTHKSAHVRDKIDEEVIRALKAEPVLGSIFAMSGEVTDGDIEKLKAISMTGLVIKSESISSRVLRAFEGHRSISEISLRSTKITDQTIDDLLSLPTLTKLSLHDAQITDEGMQRLIAGLAEHSQTRWLELSGCTKLTNGAFLGIQRMKGLVQLYLNDNTEVTSQVFDEVGKIETLRELRFGGAIVDPADIESISGLALDRLHFANGKLTDEVIASAVAAFPDLTQIGLAESNVSDESMKSLAKLKGLEWIFMHGTNVTDVGLEHLKPLQNLKYVFVSRGGISPEAVQSFHEQHPGTKLRLN